MKQQDISHFFIHFLETYHTVAWTNFAVISGKSRTKSTEEKLLLCTFRIDFSRSKILSLVRLEEKTEIRPILKVVLSRREGAALTEIQTLFNRFQI
jgi:hypothetical protein